MPERLSAKENELAKATSNLTARVASLTGVVQTNNNEIKRLRGEINKKPDDSEVQFITGLARQQRSRHTRFAIYTAVGSAVLSGVISFLLSSHMATEQIHDRNRVGYSGCVATNDRIQAISNAFTNVAKVINKDSRAHKEILDGAANINATTRDCERLYPKDQR